MSANELDLQLCLDTSRIIIALLILVFLPRRVRLRPLPLALLAQSVLVINDLQVYALDHGRGRGLAQHGKHRLLSAPWIRQGPRYVDAMESSKVYLDEEGRFRPTFAYS